MSHLPGSGDLWELMPSNKVPSPGIKIPPVVPKKSPDLRGRSPLRPQKPAQLRSPPPLVKPASTPPPVRVEKPLWLRSPTNDGISDFGHVEDDTVGPRITLIDNEGGGGGESGPRLPPRPPRVIKPPHPADFIDQDSPHNRPPLPLRPSSSVRSIASFDSSIPKELTSEATYQDSIGRPPVIYDSSDDDSSDDDSEARPSLPPRPKSTSALARVGTEPARNFNSILAEESMTTDPDNEPPPPPLPRRTETANNVFDDALAKTSTGLNVAGTEIRKFGMTVGSKVREVGSNVQTPSFLLPIRDDFNDVGARYKGEDGLCSKCEALSVRDFTTAAGPRRADAAQIIWSSPITRAIYHASWCRMCRLLLHVLSLPGNDPLDHPAVRPFLPDLMQDMTMQQWLESGLTDSTNFETWPFGHGRERTENASHVLHPTSVYAERLGTDIGSAASRYLLGSAIKGKPGGLRDVSKSLQSTTKARRRHYYNNGGINYPSHPLSCEICISSGTVDDPLEAGILRVQLLGHGRRTEAPMITLSSFVLRVVGDREENIFIPQIGGRTPSRLPATVSTSASREFTMSFGLSVDPRWIDASVAQLWLQDCEANHGSECSAHGWSMAIKTPTFLRVIDCQEMYVKTIEDPKSCRFVTLSYVWGKVNMVRLLHSNIDLLTRPGGLRRQVLPLTIRCAIEVVRAMGERYLWTDALCILQEDVAEKYEGIRQMDRIYGSSLATIVAAQGKSAASGLDGIQTQEKDGVERLVEQQRAVTRDGLALVAPLPTRDHNVDNSVWNSRAWTFQERLLSRRLIIFTHGQVLWHCRGMICREDMKVSESGIDYKALQWLSLKPNSFVGHDQDWSDGSIVRTRQGSTDLVRSSTMHEYVKAVEQYSHRQLSFQDDVLNAFAGLGDIFAQALGTQLLAGLPEQHLDTAMHWRPMQRLKRRRGFPSWSWAGWIGRVAYNEPFGIQRRIDGVFSEFQTTAYGEEGIRPVIRWHKQSSSGKIAPVNGMGLGFPWETGGQLPREWDQGPYCSDEATGFAAPVTSGLKIDSNTGSAHPTTLPPASPDTHSPRLVFWTGCASWPALRLGEAISDPSDRAITTAQAPLRFQLVSREGDVEGNILMDSAETTNGPEVLNSSGHWALLEIAEAKYFLSTGENRDVHGCPLVAVMLVEWMDKERREGLSRVLCERRGLGRISKAGWMLAQPRMRLISLG